MGDSPWLDAWRDPVAGITAFSSCMAMVNLNGDGDYKLVLADATSQKIRVYKGMVDEACIDSYIGNVGMQKKRECWYAEEQNRWLPN
jgi:hypothetical protein